MAKICGILTAIAALRLVQSFAPVASFAASTVLSRYPYLFALRLLSTDEALFDYEAAVAATGPCVVSSRRTVLSRIAFGSLVGTLVGTQSVSSRPAFASMDDPEPRAITTVVLQSDNDRAGVELYDVTIGTPPRSVVAVKSLSFNGLAASRGVQPGMILLGTYPDGARGAAKRIRGGPFPVELRFYDLAAGGDAIGDMGRPIVSAQDALRTAQAASGPLEDDQASGVRNLKVGGQGERDGLDSGLGIDVVRKAEGMCSIQSRRGDVMEIRYEARVGGRDGPLYDSSEERGTGQPYQYILGNGDVIRGVDLGTYDMCPGDVRELDIPPTLGYGEQRGSRLYRIPPGSRLWWRIELVALNFVKDGENTSKRDEMYEGGSGLLPIYR